MRQPRRVLRERSRAFAVLRRRNHQADAARTPAERLSDAAVLFQLARAPGSTPSRTDEPWEVYRRLRARSRR
ncbi:MAG: hypothetical protein HY909_22800 [Deltaproteobacteria bacterium]|nr:hypothetical protein [Deltaproteobacteria bacterium]